jgi:hypothetical protein
MRPSAPRSGSRPICATPARNLSPPPVSQEGSFQHQPLIVEHVIERFPPSPEQRRQQMGARSKLNVAFLNGSVFVAALVGLLCKSWVAFGIVLTVLLIGNFLMGEIRPGKRGRE